METSTEMKQIAAALAKSQAEFPAFGKDKTAVIRTKSGAEYSYSYADLGTIISKTAPILSQNGICVSQGLDIGETTAKVTTMLLHASGEWIRYSLNLPIVDAGNNAIQAAGSSFTYGRRYALSAALGISSEADDDANSAGEGKAKKKAAPKKASPVAVESKEIATVIGVEKKESANGKVYFVATFETATDGELKCSTFLEPLAESLSKLTGAKTLITYATKGKFKNLVCIDDPPPFA